MARQNDGLGRPAVANLTNYGISGDPMVLRFQQLFSGLGQLVGMPPHSAASKLYWKIVEQARKPVFYSSLGVPDTVEGRFDLVGLHTFLVLRRLKGQAKAKDLGQQLFNAMFDDMDASLREMGVGDTRVPKRVRELAEDFTGRVQAYDAAFDDPDALASAIARNVFDQPNEEGGAVLASYAIQVSEHLTALPIEQLATGQISFLDPVQDGVPK
ncbi:MAG: ubiquinol-cytochrome C chaperone family protein [Pseudomonadota bacterium]